MIVQFAPCGIICDSILTDGIPLENLDLFSLYPRFNGHQSVSSDNTLDIDVDESVRQVFSHILHVILEEYLL